MENLKPDTLKLIQRLMDYGVPEPVLELRFYRPRQWRFDLAWPQRKVAVERHGMGRHIRPAGFIADRDKINTAVCLGWRVLEFTPRHLDKRNLELSVRRVLCALDMIDHAEVIDGIDMERRRTGSSQGSGDGPS